MLLLFSMLTTVMHNSMLFSLFSQQISTAQPLSHTLLMYITCEKFVRNVHARAVILAIVTVYHLLDCRVTKKIVRR